MSEVIKSVSVLRNVSGHNQFSDPIKLGVDVDAIEIGDKIKASLKKLSPNFSAEDIDSAVAEVADAIYNHENITVNTIDGAHGLRYNADDSTLEYFDGNEWKTASSKVDKASTTAEGIVKLSDATDITDSTGLALPATEKNAEIDGTLAKKISDLNDNVVNGIKGDNETNYRKGNVNLTAANIGALATTGNSSNTSVTYTNADVTDEEATEWTSIAPLTTPLKLSDIVSKASTMFKNVRYLFNKTNELNSNFTDTLTASDGTSFRFGVTDDGEYGYITQGEDGADTVNPFSKSYPIEFAFTWWLSPSPSTHFKMTVPPGCTKLSVTFSYYTWGKYTSATGGFYRWPPTIAGTQLSLTEETIIENLTPGEIIEDDYPYTYGTWNPYGAICACKFYD